MTDTSDSPGADADDDRPRIPTPEEAATYRPAHDLFVALLDIVSEAAGRSTILQSISSKLGLGNPAGQQKQFEDF